MPQILIPTDFSVNAKKAAEYALTQFGPTAQYTLLNSYEVPHSGATMLISIADILEKDSLQLLRDEQERLLKIFPDLNDKLSIKAIEGQATMGIKKMTQAGNYDYVVMGTKGASGLKSLLIGSVAANTMSEVTCPVLAVPEDAPLKKIGRILFAVDDKTLNGGQFPTGLPDLVKGLDAEIMLLNVVPVGELGHVGNNSSNQRKPIGSFEELNYSIHYTEGEDVSIGIIDFIKENPVDLLAMVTRKKDFFFKLFGVSNTKQMMTGAQLPILAFH